MEIKFSEYILGAVRDEVLSVVFVVCCISEWCARNSKQWHGRFGGKFIRHTKV